MPELQTLKDPVAKQPIVRPHIMSIIYQLNQVGTAEQSYLIEKCCISLFRRETTNAIAVALEKLDVDLIMAFEPPSLDAKLSCAIRKIGQPTNPAPHKYATLDKDFPYNFEVCLKLVRYIETLQNDPKCPKRLHNGIKKF